MTNKAAINALAIALLQHRGGNVFDFNDAMTFAQEFFDENADLFTAKVDYGIERGLGLTPALGQRVAEALDAVVVAPESQERAQVLHVPVVGPDGLTDRQRRGLGTVGLCPNCQQPNNNHAPACARASGEDPKAITKNAIPPLA